MSPILRNRLAALLLLSPLTHAEVLNVGGPTPHFPDISNGSLQISLPARSLPHLGHEVLHLQAVFEGAQIYIGSPSWSVILDAAW